MCCYGAATAIAVLVVEKEERICALILLHVSRPIPAKAKRFSAVTNVGSPIVVEHRARMYGGGEKSPLFYHLHRTEVPV